MLTAELRDNPAVFTGTGIALWVLTSAAAFSIARMLPWQRRRKWLAELTLAIATGLAMGALATALDFGGWSEPDWRAGVFVFLGAFAAVGVARLAGRS